MGAYFKAFPLLIVPLLLNACLFAGMNRSLTDPCTLKFRIDTYKPETVSVRVLSDKEKTYLFDSSGRLEFEAPPINPSGCTTAYAFILIHDGSAEKNRAFQLIRNNKNIRRFSLAEIRKMPMDDQGHHLADIHPAKMGINR